MEVIHDQEKTLECRQYCISNTDVKKSFYTVHTRCKIQTASLMQMKLKLAGGGLQYNCTRAVR